MVMLNSQMVTAIDDDSEESCKDTLWTEVRPK
jgi:hypothetical protein